MKTLTKFTAAALFATSLIGLAGCATPGDKEPELVVDGEEWECRRQKEIGSNLGKKVCASPAEWAAREKAEKEASAETSRLIRERGGAAGPASGGIGN